MGELCEPEPEDKDNPEKQTCPSKPMYRPSGICCLHNVGKNNLEQEVNDTFMFQNSRFLGDQKNDTRFGILLYLPFIIHHLIFQ